MPEIRSKSQARRVTVELENGDVIIGAELKVPKAPKYTYSSAIRATMQEQDAWWIDCPHCDYEGPEPPEPGLEARPGHHEVWLCPSCRGVLPFVHPAVVQAIDDRLKRTEVKAEPDAV